MLNIYDAVAAAVRQGDSELGASLLPLAGISKDLGRWLDLPARTVDHEQMLKSKWSSSELTLVRVSWDFWNGDGHTSFSRILSVRDARSMRLVIGAMELAAYPHSGPYLDAILGGLD